MNFAHTPRLFLDCALELHHVIPLSEDQTHYLKTVLRSKEGEIIRVFNGKSDEFAATWSPIGKKTSSLTITQSIRAFADDVTSRGGINHLRLYMPLIKKDRLDWMIEKAVELGVTDIHPLITDHVGVRDFKRDRVLRQIIEASEQCERLTIPTLHAPAAFKGAAWEGHENGGNKDDERATAETNAIIFVGLERADHAHLAQKLDDIKNNIKQGEIANVPHDIGFLCGPEGGFSSAERDYIESRAQNAPNQFIPVSLGRRILRAETAAITGLGLLGALDRV